MKSSLPFFSPARLTSGLLCALAIAVATPLPAQVYNLSTLGGTGGFAGATDTFARFNDPMGVALDAAGNGYVADRSNHTIRKVSSAGAVSTLAGAAGLGGSTDATGGGARFSSPAAVAVDGAGNVYVADTGNHTIRRITSAGVVTTFAGAAGVPGVTNATGTAARFNSPGGVTVDSSGNLYVADTGNHTIRKITPAGAVTTFAGIPGVPSTAISNQLGTRFTSPQSVAVDSAGNVYVANTGDHTIMKITSAGSVSSLAGLTGNAGSTNATGVAARFSSPSGVAVDAAGNVYVGDTGNHTVRKITSTGVVTLLAGLPGTSGGADGSGAIAKFNAPFGVATNAAGELVVADNQNHTLRKVSVTGAVTTWAGSTGDTGSVDGSGVLARFNSAIAVAADAAGNIYVAEYITQTIRKITSSGAVTTLAGLAGSAGTVDGTGSGARFAGPTGVAADGAGNLYVADQPSHTIRKITSAGVVTTFAGSAGNSGLANGSAGAARFNGPNGVAVDSAGNVYVADSGNHAIRKITSGGVVTTLAGPTGEQGYADGTGDAVRFASPYAVAVDSAGNVYVADFANMVIRKVTSTGVVSTLAGTKLRAGSANGTGAAARFYFPEGVAVDGAGNVLVADTGNHLVRTITPAGVVTTLAGFPGVSDPADGIGGSAQFHTPRGLAVDSGGNVLVADSGSHTIRRITSGGRVTTLAGVSTVSGSVDGAARAPTQFNGPYAVAVGRGGLSGNVLVADRTNHTLRRITLNASAFGPEIVPAGRVSTMAGAAGSPGSTNGAIADARFNNPAGVAMDNLGVTYVADTGNHTIRKVVYSLGFAETGTVSTLAGLAGTSGSANGTGSEGRFNNPAGVTTNHVTTAAGVVVYVADAGNHTIRKITSTGVVTTLAGLAGSSGATNGNGGAARFNNPTGVVVSRLPGPEVVYVADSGNHTIRKITSTGDVTTVAGLAGSQGSSDGTGSAARFNAPTSVAVDDDDNLYVTDTGNHVIRKITPAGVVSTVVGSAGTPGSLDGVGSAARFSSPRGLSMDSEGNFFLADTGNHTIRQADLRIAPAIKQAPPTDITVRVGEIATITVEANGNPEPTYQWFKDGVALTQAVEGADGPEAPPGPSGFNTRTLEFSPAALTDAGTYTVVAANFVGSVTSSGTILRVVVATGSPTITTQPVAQTAAPGSAVTFSVGATGTPPLTYQWRKDGTAITGATSASLNLPAVTAGDAGNYSVVVTNGIGTATSNPAALTIATGGGSLAIATQPIVQTAVEGTSVTLSVVATGAPPLSYQWRRNDVPLPGATSSSLTLLGVEGRAAGRYSVVVTNASGSVTSADATLTVVPTSTLSNLSVRTTLAGGQILIVGAVVSGGAKPILVRAAGPALAGFGLPGMVDPRLELYTGATQPAATNDNWQASLAPRFATVAAFPFLTGSRDAALEEPLGGGFTVQALGTGPGTVLVEAYDVTGGFTPRLVNLSARNQVGTDADILIAGFNIAGTGSKQVLIRAVGPSLARFGVTNFLVDPRLQVFNSANREVAANDDWNDTLAATFTQVAAFPFAPNSRDAALLVTLAAGASYTVQVSGANGGTGEALIEVYEIF